MVVLYLKQEEASLEDVGSVSAETKQGRSALLILICWQKRHWKWHTFLLGYQAKIFQRLLKSPPMQ